MSESSYRKTQVRKGRWDLDVPVQHIDLQTSTKVITTLWKEYRLRAYRTGVIHDTERMEVLRTIERNEARIVDVGIGECVVLSWTRGTNKRHSHDCNVKH